MAFQIGDKVVHPAYGAGVLEGIEARKVGGRMQEFYIMKLPKRSMVIMIPTENSEEIGVRPVIGREQAGEILAAIPAMEVEMTSNWNHRYRENMERLKSGDLMEVARVIKGLSARESQRGLSTGERKMLLSARQIFISELVLSTSREYEAVEEDLDTALA